MSYKEFAVGTPHETHTLIAGYFTAKIRKGKYVYYIDCADTCPIDIARIDMPKETFTAQMPPWHFLFFPFSCFLGLHPRHMEVPRLGVESEL